MAKLTAWLVTLLGLWLLLAKLDIIPASIVGYQDWVIAVVVTIIGIGKLVRNYRK